MNKKRFFCTLLFILIFISAFVCYKNPYIFTNLKEKVDLFLSDDVPSANDNYEYYTKVEFYRESLNKEEQHVYDTIYKNAVKHNEKNFKIKKISIDTLNKIFNFVLYDHEELFYVDTVTYTPEKNSYTKQLKINYNLDKQLRAIYESDLKYILDNILVEVETLSDYEKAQYAHDYIIANTDYEVNLSNSQNILSVFVNYQSTSTGYSKAYQYILKRVGVYCVFVPGENIEDGERTPHSLNLLKLDDDQYYYVDTTFDEAEDFPIPDVLKYNYFNLTTEDVLRNFDFNENLPKLPIADSLKYNYFDMRNLYFKKYDDKTKSTITDLIVHTIENQKASIGFKFENSEDFYTFEKDFKKNHYDYMLSVVNTYFKESKKAASSFNCRFDDHSNVATIFFLYD